jgi:hypothetical protein
LNRVVASNALAWVSTVKTLLAPVVLRRMTSVEPAFGPSSINALYPARLRGIVWFVVIVLVVPAVAERLATPIVDPVDPHESVIDEANVVPDGPGILTRLPCS